MYNNQDEDLENFNKYLNFARLIHEFKTPINFILCGLAKSIEFEKFEKNKKINSDILKFLKPYVIMLFF